jgi:hypothetical protein
MAKKINLKIKIPNFREIIILLKDKLKKLLSECFLYFKKLFKDKFRQLFSWYLSCFKKALRQAVADIKNKKWRGLIALTLAIAAYFLWGLSSALLWLLFMAFLVYGWENRLIVVFALISLTSCPFLLSFKKDAWAETMAIYAYFFLIMTVILQLVEYKRHPERFPDNENSNNK